MSAQVFVVPGDSQLPWEPVPQEPEDPRPVAEEVVSFRSEDGRFAVGFWRRDPEEGPMDLAEFHEVMLLLEGRVEIQTEDGETLIAGPGDLIVAPRGARATWRALTPVRKVWAIYREP
ncbi:MAG: hypothetical protein KatS3mg011_0010 [Acidimicrobiia bacterium]|nr:MAG: hypothetical protein KatS3mg011_0010 [Acidimicrobiia bacterium]